MAGLKTSEWSSDSLWPDSSSFERIKQPFLPQKKPSELKELLHPIDSTPEFHDPYSELNLFLSQKIKEEFKESGFVKKWSFYLQEKLVEKIAPEFQRKFPQYRLGIAALKKTWEKIAYFSQQIQTQKEALTDEGKINVHFLIKENLKQYFQFKNPSGPNPLHFAHQLAMKISEYLATIDGVRPMLDHLTKTIWAGQKHLLTGTALEQAQSPYNEFDKFDKLIVKVMLEINGKNPQITQKELEAKVKEAIKALQDLPNFASIDRITANVSALLAEKLYPSSSFHTLYFLEQKSAIFNFISRHIALYKTATFELQFSDLVRRTIALYTLACELPKTLTLEEIQTAVNELHVENRSFPQSIYAFISAELLLTQGHKETIWDAYQEAKNLPPLSPDHLEMIVWKVVSDKEGLLEQLPYRVGQKIDEEIAHILIDNPHQNFTTIVNRTVQFFRKAKELALSKKWPEIERKISLWTIQGDLLCRWIHIESDNNALLKLIIDEWKPKAHTRSISEITQSYLAKYPNMTPYIPQLMSRIAILYKYAWYAVFSTPEESSLDRFIKWHALDLSHLNETQALTQLEEICKKTIPLLPFDPIHAQKLLYREGKEPSPEQLQA